MKNETKEDYNTCKCGGEVEYIKTYPAGDIRIGRFTTATISIQRCKKCGRYRKIEGDVGEPMKLLMEFSCERCEKKKKRELRVFNKRPFYESLLEKWICFVCEDCGKVNYLIRLRQIPNAYLPKSKTKVKMTKDEGMVQWVKALALGLVFIGILALNLVGWEILKTLERILELLK